MYSRYAETKPQLRQQIQGEVVADSSTPEQPTVIVEEGNIVAVPTLLSLFPDRPGDDDDADIWPFHRVDSPTVPVAVDAAANLFSHAPAPLATSDPVAAPPRSPFAAPIPVAATNIDDDRRSASRNPRGPLRHSDTSAATSPENGPRP